VTYCTKQLLIDRFGEPALVAATDRADEPTGTIDEAAVARAIADTEAVIDGYVGVRYALPLTDVPTIVTDLALAIAIYRLHPAAAGEKITADYREAMKQLREIGEGKIKLTAAGLESAGSGDGGVTVTETERPFTNEKMKGWI
jgi:phage gp36-like protein